MASGSHEDLSTKLNKLTIDQKQKGKAKKGKQMVPQRSARQRVRADRKFEHMHHMVSIDTESKSFPDRRTADESYILVWDVAVIPLTEDFFPGGEPYKKTMREDFNEVHVQKHPPLFSSEDWEALPLVSEKELKRDLFEALNGKYWIGFNISRHDVKNIKFIFRDDECPRPLGVFDVLDWLRSTSLKEDLKIPDMTLNTLCYAYGMSKQVHRALEDAEACVNVLRSSMEYLGIVVEEMYKKMETRTFHPTFQNTAG